MDQTPLRGREVSRALTEIRTVLSRAESALEVLSGPTERLYEADGDGLLRDENGQWMRAYDPDHHQMVGALRVVVGALSEWQRTGRPEGTEQQRKAATKGIPCRCCQQLWAGRLPGGHVPELEG